MADTHRLPVPVTETWDWQLDAACRGMDVGAFFHPAGERGEQARRREDQAKQVCSGCPVRARCLDYALEIEEPYGTWGGLGERERWILICRKRSERRAGTHLSEVIPQPQTPPRTTAPLPDGAESDA